MNINFKGITDVTGERIARKLCKAFGGQFVYFPVSYDFDSKAKRNYQIFEDYATGVKVKELSKKYKLTVAQIRCILIKERTRRNDPTQPPLSVP